MNSQSRTFVRQVQVDLLALSDTDLYHIIHQWVDERNTSGQYADLAEDTLCALGYTRVVTETHLPTDEPEAAHDLLATWQPPSPAHLRTLLVDMDANLFAQHVITLAYHSLHATYPEWYDGLTFNAHLANYLRQIHTPSYHVDIATTRNPYPTR